MQESTIVKLLDLMNLPMKLDYMRAEMKMPDENALPSGGRRIIREAMSDDDKPLYVIFLGYNRFSIGLPERACY